MSKGRIVASEAIEVICRDLQYSRPHVASVLRKHSVLLGAKLVRRRWWLPTEGAERLRELVASESGRRYKLGERGPRQ